MHELTDAGINAMAEELLRLASNGEQSWKQAAAELQTEFRDFIWSLIDKASEAEERQAATRAAAMTNERKEPRGGQDPTPPQHLPQSQARTDQAVPEDPADRPGAEAQALTRRLYPRGEAGLYVATLPGNRPLMEIPPRFEMG